MRWKLKNKNWSKITWIIIKKTGLQIKIMKETKNLEIGTEKKTRSKNFTSVAKKLFA